MFRPILLNLMCVIAGIVAIRILRESCSKATYIGLTILVFACFAAACILALITFTTTISVWRSSEIIIGGLFLF